MLLSENEVPYLYSAINEYLKSIGSEYREYVRNVVGDVVSSYGVVAMTAFNILWNGIDSIVWCISLQIGGKKFPRKIENAKVAGTGWQSIS